jgi:signal transduction histidine kinase/AraC-like DNA-binding protein
MLSHPRHGFREPMPQPKGGHMRVQRRLTTFRLEQILDGLDVVLEASAAAEAETGDADMTGRRGSDDPIVLELAGGARFSVTAQELIIEPPVPLALPQPGARKRGSGGPVEPDHSSGLMRVTLRGSTGIFDNLRERLVLKAAGGDPIRHAFEDLVDEIAARRPGWRAQAEALLRQCLILFLRRYCHGGERRLFWLAALEDEGVERAVTAMRDLPETPFTISGLAALVGMSRSVFAQRFAASLGCSPMAFLKAHRLVRASQLLTRSNLPIKSVAARAGYASRSAFSRAFVSRYNVGPSAFRGRRNPTPGLPRARHEDSTRGREPVRSAMSSDMTMNTALGPPTGTREWLVGDGEMRTLVRVLDWEATALGSRDRWPDRLRTAVDMCLSSHLPVCLSWGSELICIYNDAYRPVLGATKHPQALGRPARHVWPEIWHVRGPRLEAVLRTGQGTSGDDVMYLLDRNGYLEEAFLTFSDDAIRDENSRICGVLTVKIETTRRVLTERRLRVCRDLAERTASARSDVDACREAAAALEGNPADIPFALMYLSAWNGRQASLVASCGAAPAGPSVVELDREDDRLIAKAVARVAQAGVAEVIADLRGFSEGPAAAPPQSALVMPMPGPGGQPCGFVAAGISARRALDDPYRDFLRTVTDQIGVAVSNARAFRLKDELIAGLSHELRGPLQTVTSALHVLKAEAPGRPWMEPSLTAIERAVHAQVRLVDDLLDGSRFLLRESQLSLQIIDARPIVQSLVDAVRDTAKGKRVQVELVPGGAAVVLADPDRLQQMLWNLLSNAVKFTDSGGAITVTANRFDAEMRVSVCDTGRGMSAQFLPHVFEPFAQEPQPHRTPREGLGLGLSIVRQLAELHGGKVHATSAGPGAGATFTLSLPVPALFDTATAEEGSRSTPQAVSERLAGLRVLVVDDDPRTRDLIQAVLERAGATVVAAASVAEALQDLALRPPDVMVCDLVMPGEDGFGLPAHTRALRSTTGRRVPAVALSAYLGEREHALDAGFDAWLAKPAESSALIGLLASLAPGAA